MRADYRIWLTRQKYDPRTIATQLAQAGRVEKDYGDLDQLFAADRLESVLATLQYTTEDKRLGRPNPSKIPIEGDIRNNLASYKSAVRRYRQFRDIAPRILSEFAEADAQPEITGPTGTGVEEDLGQRIGLERDMQAALRKAI